MHFLTDELTVTPENVCFIDEKKRKSLAVVLVKVHVLVGTEWKMQIEYLMEQLSGT